MKKYVVTSSLIKEGNIYEIKNPKVQLAERAFNPTKCDYKLIIDDSCTIITAPDNGNFTSIKYSIVPLDKIKDYPKGKKIDVFGFVLEDKGYKEIVLKNEKNLKFHKLTFIGI